MSNKHKPYNVSPKPNNVNPKPKPKSYNVSPKPKSKPNNVKPYNLDIEIKERKIENYNRQILEFSYNNLEFTHNNTNKEDKSSDKNLIKYKLGVLNPIPVVVENSTMNKMNIINKCIKCEHNAEVENIKLKGLLLFIDVKDLKSINKLFGIDTGSKCIEFLKGKIESEIGKIKFQILDKFVIEIKNKYYSLYLNNKMDLEEIKTLINLKTGYLKKWFKAYIKNVCHDKYEVDLKTSYTIVNYEITGLMFLELMDDYWSRYKSHDYTALKYVNINILENKIKHNLLYTDLMKVIDNDEIVMYLQPKINLKSGNISSAEALARRIIKDGEKSEIIPPSEFIPFFEETGLIKLIDLHIFKRACEFINNLIKEGKECFPISTNMSKASLCDPNLVVSIEKILEGFPKEISKYIEIEVTESIFTRSNLQENDNLHKLSNLGINIILDDFGKGESNLGRLSELYLHTVKLDSSFFLNSSEEKSFIIITYIVNMLNKLNIKVVAEGVEDNCLVKFLKLIKVDEIQGYIFDKPMDVDSFQTKYIKSKNTSDDKQNEQNKL